MLKKKWNVQPLLFPTKNRLSLWSLRMIFFSPFQTSQNKQKINAKFFNTRMREDNFYLELVFDENLFFEFDPLLTFNVILLDKIVLVET